MKRAARRAACERAAPCGPLSFPVTRVTRCAWPGSASRTPASRIRRSSRTPWRGTSYWSGEPGTRGTGPARSAAGSPGSAASSTSGRCGGSRPFRPRAGEARRRTLRRSCGPALTGEQLVATEFGKALSDDWVLVRGYCNRRGEIDHLLLGPPGLIAIESKHLNATVSCDGDDWRYRKFDRSGNLVAQGPIADRRGRSPSVQLGEPATMLEEFLSSQGGAGGAGDTVSMLRVVLFTHPRSRLGNCRNTSVHVVTSAAALAVQLGDMPPVLAAAHRARLEELIARDHRYHDGRRQRSAAARPPGPRGGTNGARTGRSARSASR